MMKTIAQLRNNFLFEAQEEYDCGGNASIDWVKTGTKNLQFGLFCIGFSIVVIPIYLLVARAMWNLADSPCYKIMFTCAINDCVNVVTSSTIFGIFLCFGEMYCKHPLLHGTYSMAATFVYVQSGCLCILLAINRFIEYTSKRMYTIMFQGKRAWALFLLTLPFPAFVAFCTPLFFFNSEFHMLLLNPGIYEDRFLYHNVFHAVNNTLVPCFPLFLYAFILGDVIINHRKNAIRKEAMIRTALMLSVQSGFVVLVHFNACITYEVTQYITISDGVLYWAHFGWMLIHGLPPFIHLAFNPSIRKGVTSQVSKSKASVFVVSGVSVPSQPST